MKLTAITAAAIFALSTSANATALGGGFSSDSEVKFDYNLDTEVYTLTLSPEIEYSMGAMDFSIGTDVNLRDVGFTGMDWTLEMDIESVPGMGVFGKITTDKDWEAGDLNIGATFSF